MKTFDELVQLSTDENLLKLLQKTTHHAARNRIVEEQKRREFENEDRVKQEISSFKFNQ